MSAIQSFAVESGVGERQIANALIEDTISPDMSPYLRSPFVQANTALTTNAPDPPQTIAVADVSLSPLLVSPKLPPQLDTPRIIKEGKQERDPRVWLWLPPKLKDQSTR
jgi:hypothetical protein